MNRVYWPVIGVSEGSQQRFVTFWDRLYSGYDEDFYAENIGRPLTKERIEQWFEWKNGMRLSPKKVKSIQRYSQPEEQIGESADLSMVREYLKRPGGVIWRIFLLHLQHPHRFPIYDQHVHRAMAYLLQWPNLDIPSPDSKKIHAYIDSYLPFQARFADFEHRQVDRALWTFGRFLASPYANILHVR